MENGDSSVLLVFINFIDRQIRFNVKTGAGKIYSRDFEFLYKNDFFFFFENEGPHNIVLKKLSNTEIS